MRINGGDTMLTLTPVTLAAANTFVNAHHRHHKATAGHKFSIGCAKDGELVGVAIVGRPVSRYLDDGWTLEVNRLCTTGEKNACSILYAASARAAKAMGYRKIITYTLDSESGSSLRAAGWSCAGMAGGKCWTGSRIENWKYNATYSGSPQGGICSPILANIYLNELDKKFREIAERFDKPRSAYQTPEYHAASKELKRLSYWIDHTADEAARQELIDQHRAQKEAMRNLPCKPADNKKFTFVRYADDWLAGVCGTKAECEDLKAEIAEFLSTELKLTLSEEKTLITHSSEKVRFIGYDICVRRNQEVKGHRMKNGTWRKSRTLHMKVALSVPHTEKIEKFMFAKKVIRQKENGEFQPIHRAGLLNLADYEIVEQYNAEARGLCNYYNLACDYHTLDYFCYLMEYSCLKTIANKHKTSIRKIIRQYKDGKTWSVPYETKAGTKRVRPVKIADCKRGEASDIIYQRKKFSWKTTIRQRLNARVCELCGCKEADLYEVHVIRNLNELGNSDWETVMKKKRRKTLVVCSKCHERIHRH